MTVTRRSVLQALAAFSDAEQRETTTTESLRTALGASAGEVESQVDALVACELATVDPDGGIRATITGEELLALDTDELVIVAPAGDDRDT